MTVVIDQALCSGCGICVDACSEVFAFNAEGKAEVIKETCDSCTLEEVADQCPVNAIEVSE
jgi:ferredoxin